MSRRILLLLMVIKFLGPGETAKRRFNFLIHNVTCLKFGDLVRKLECNFQKLETNRYSLNMSGFLQRQLSKDAEFLGMIHIKPAKRMTPIKFAEVRLKICETLTMPALPIPIAKTIFNEIMTKSNAPFSCPIKGTAKRHFNFLIHNVTCLKFGSLVRTFECNFRKLQTNRYNVNISVVLERQLSKDAEFLGVIHIKPAKRITPLKFAEVRLKICETLTMQALPIPIAKTIFNEIMTKSNFPFTCPIKGNVSYKITDLELSSEMFPSYTIIVDFNFTLNFYDLQKKFISVAVQGATVPIKV
ncbi:uncharacterized protein LOC109612916 [Musca domestica]|uniref:Uncharacterized protein LOC109612916 n=1 Tax=Musca domestica TaxID=7370 RepID=A0A9J7IE54_MUSDO|nr:uncharacterized protein LOC109612916 [Musca domestica]